MAIKTTDDLLAALGTKKKYSTTADLLKGIEEKAAKTTAPKAPKASIMLPTAQAARNQMARGGILLPRAIETAAQEALAREDTKRASVLPLPTGRDDAEELRSEVRQRTQLAKGTPAAQVAGQINARDNALKTGKEAWEASAAGIKARSEAAGRTLEKFSPDAAAYSALRFAQEQEPGSVPDWVMEKYQGNALKAAQAYTEQMGLAGQYYHAENREKLGSIQGDTSLSGKYSNAKTLKEDMEKIAAVLADRQGGGGDPAAIRQNKEYLSQKYGITQAAVDQAAISGRNYQQTEGGYGNLWQLYDELEARVGEDTGAMAAGGYDFARMAGYEQRQEDAKVFAGKMAQAESDARTNPVGTSAATVLASPAKGLEYLGALVKSFGHSNPAKIEWYVPLAAQDMPITGTVNAIRGTVSKGLEDSTDLELFGRNVASFLYNTGMSIADSTVQVGTLGSFATLTMGMGAAADTTKDIIERGGSNRQALWGGLAAGAAEAAFEKFSIDNLLKVKDVAGWKDVLRETAKQAGVEASEEMFTEVANILADGVIMGERSNFTAAVQEYMAQDMSAEEAKKRAYLDSIADIAWAGAGGALSGGVMGGVKGSIDYAGSRAIRMPTGAEGNVMPGGTERATPGQQKTASTGETVGLNPISASMESSLSTGKNNIVAKTVDDIVYFVKTALAKKGGSERLYMGTIPESTASFIKSNTGMDVAGYTAILPGSSVQHIFNRHGDEKTEASRGQRAVLEDDVALIPQVLATPDSVTLSDDTDNLGRSVLLFSKQIGDNIVTAQAVTDGRKALTTNSVWVQKKKNPLVTTSDANAAIDPAHNVQNVPPSGSSYDTTIQQADAGVKEDDSRKVRGLRMPGGETETNSQTVGNLEAAPPDVRPLPGGETTGDGYLDGLVEDFQRREGAPGTDHMTPKERAMWERGKSTVKKTAEGEYRGTPATDKLGIKLERPITELGRSQSIRAAEKAKYEAGRALDRVLKESFATEAERAFARGVADGIYTMRQMPPGMHTKTITPIVEAMQTVDSFNKKTLKDQRAGTNWEYDAKIQDLIKDSDKKTSPGALSLNSNTMQRNNERTWGKDAAAINAELFDPISSNEAERIRFVNRTLEQVGKYKLNASESAMVQRLMEGDITEGELRAKGYDAPRLSAAAKTLSGIYGDFYEAVNDFLVAHGYKEIGFQKNYAPHMQEEQTDTLQKYLQRLGFQTEVTELPTDLAGRTDTFKPGKQYNPYFQPRVGNKTKLDAVGGLESYVNYLSNVFYHTDDIQKLRRFSEALRTKYSGAELSAELDRLNHLQDRLSSEDMDLMGREGVQELKEAAFARYGNMSRFGNYVSVLDDYTNILAGKQPKFDRAVESLIGRKGLNLGRNIQNAFSRAAIVGNLSSVVSQTVQLPQLVAEVGSKYATQAIIDVATGKTGKVGFNQESDFLTGKRGIRSISEKRNSEKFFDFASKPFEVVDDLASRIIVRAKYLEQVAKGEDHSGALKAADQFAARLVGSRTKGAKPVIFEQKNPLSKLVTTFQLEVANGWQHMLHDLPMEIRHIAETKGKGAAAKRTAELVVAGQISAFVANVLIKALTGREPVPFDGIGMIANYMASGYGMTKEDYMKMVADNAAETVTGMRPLGTTREVGNFDVPRAMKTAGEDILEDTPFLSSVATMLGITDGRLPLPQVWNSQMSAAVGELGTALTTEDQEERSEALGAVLPRAGEGLTNIGATWLPMGSQIKKTAQGAQALLRGGVYSGYGEDEKLRYAVEQTPANIARGLLFGRSALPETDAYYAEGAKTLTTAQTAAYNDLLENGMTREGAYSAIQDIRGIKKTDDAGKQLRQIQALRSLDATEEQKRVIYQGIITDSREEEMEAAEKARVPFDKYLDAHAEYLRLNAKEGKSSGKATDFAHWLDGQGLSKAQYRAVRESFRFYSQVPNENTTYEKLVAAGVPKSTAYQMSEQIEGLTPKSGGDAVSTVQKGLRIANGTAGQKDKMAALSAVLSESLYEKATEAVSAQIDVALFLSAYEAQSGVKGDKNAKGETIRLSESRNKKAAIDEVAASLPIEQRLALYEAFGVSKEVWSGLSLPTGTKYTAKDAASGQSYVPRGGVIYMPRAGETKYLPRGDGK